MNDFILEKNQQVGRDSEGGSAAGKRVGEDLINHPSHYTKGIECWDYIVSHGLGYLEGNIIKYVTRYRFKDGLKDLRKAAAYLNRLIEELTPGPIVDDLDYLEEWAPPGTRINGAIPLPPSSEQLRPILDGRNCPPSCDCSDHICPEELHSAFTPMWEAEWSLENCQKPLTLEDLDRFARADRMSEINCMIEIPYVDAQCDHPEEVDGYCLGDYHRGNRWMRKPWINE